MSDNDNVTTDQSTGESTTPAIDLSTITKALTEEFDKRFQGFQSLLDRRTSEFQSQLEELKTADLSPEEQEQFRERELQKKMAQLERENTLLKMRKQFPEEVDLLEQFFGADSLEGQLDLLSKFRKAQAEAEAQGAESTEQPTPVDMNNPPRRQEPSLTDLAGQMTKELADKILSDGGNTPGLLRRLRGG